MTSHGPRPSRRGSTAGRPAGARSVSITAAVALLALACAPEAPEGAGLAGPSSPGVTLAWERPTSDAEGDRLGDLAGFRIYVDGQSPVERDRAEVVEVGDTTRHTFADLSPGVHHLAIAAVDTAGNESALSDELRLEVESP